MKCLPSRRETHDAVVAAVAAANALLDLDAAFCLVFCWVCHFLCLFRWGSSADGLVLGLLPYIAVTAAVGVAVAGVGVGVFFFLQFFCFKVLKV